MHTCARTHCLPPVHAVLGRCAGSRGTEMRRLALRCAGWAGVNRRKGRSWGTCACNSRRPRPSALRWRPI
eukprot:3188863-Rhodomonas_salina.1